MWQDILPHFVCGGIGMKRVLHIISQYPGSTGSGIYLQSLIKEGHRKSYVQGLIAGISVDDDIKPEYIEDFYPLRFNTNEIPFPIVGMSDVMPYESTKYSSLTKEMLIQLKAGFQKTIKEAIEEFEPDIIISHHLWVATSLVKEIASDIKVIGVCHGTDIRQFMNCPQYVEEVLTGCGELDIVLSLSEEQKKDIHNIYNISKDKIKIIGGGYSTDLFFPSLNEAYEEEIRIIYAGKLSYAKGLISLLNVFSEIKDKYKIKLLLVGLGTGEEERLIKNLGIEIGSSVEFLGELTQGELGQVFRGADIFVLPSFYEGLSLVTIEALASGLLVVSTELDNLKDYLGEEINNSGIIEYVRLPGMLDVDKPVEDDIPSFNKRFRIGIEKQISRLEEGFILEDKVDNEIKKFSWERIFARIERFM